MALEDLYKEIVIEHYQHPKHHGHLEHFEAKAEGSNPLCGDEIGIELQFDGDVIKQIMFTGGGCSISQSAIDMLADIVKGKSTTEIHKIIEEYKKMLQGEQHDPDIIGDLEALSEVKKYPARVKCASLSYAVLEQAINQKK
ncbi:MAG: SUF system NifU family Fe-S cluster assembly protein [Deltaproteobacteria bacterium]|nr:SUF system NifU family Fe-S cluster assembly protein [Deltaproteobacteria bacterium]MCL5792160.1 SUF system NifU family Fe-S cluster assembly protein [Deltaproteobacteria bacterium]